MKTFITALSFLFILPITSDAQLKLPKILAGKTGTGVSENEAGQGIKEALLQGVTTAVLNLNKTDGFFGSEVYKMFLPEDALKAEKTLRKIGMGAQVDNCLLYTSPSPRDRTRSRMPSSA